VGGAGLWPAGGNETDVLVGKEGGSNDGFEKALDKEEVGANPADVGKGIARSEAILA